MQDLTTGPVTRHLLKTTSFMLVTMVFQTLYFLIDLYWVGRLGTQAVAAVGIAGNLSFMVLALTQMLGVGTTTVVSHAVGRKDHEQALLLFNIGNAELTAGELRSRGYYLGSNVSYNLKKLVDLGFINHQRSRIDRRSVRVSLTPKGQAVAEVVGGLYERHIGSIDQVGGINQDEFKQMNRALQRLDRFWNDTIAYRM